MSELRDVIISLLSPMVMISFILTTLLIAYFVGKLEYNIFISCVIGFLTSTISHGIIFLAIQNNEYLKEIRDTRKITKMNNDLLKEIRDNTKK